MRRWRPSLLSPVNEDVENDHRNHEADDDQQSAGLSEFVDGLAGGLSRDAFPDEEDHVAAVQNGDRQEVEHGQIDAQETEEKQQLGWSLLRDLEGNLCDSDGASQIENREVAREQASQCQVDVEGVAPRVVSCHRKCLTPGLALQDLSLIHI